MITFYVEGDDGDVVDLRNETVILNLKLKKIEHRLKCLILKINFREENFPKGEVRLGAILNTTSSRSVTNQRTLKL